MKKKVSKVTILTNFLSDQMLLNSGEELLVEDPNNDDIVDVQEALEKCGFATDVFNLNYDTVKELARYKTDIFLNVSDGVGDDLKSEAKVPDILDDFRLPYTGSNGDSIRLTTDKTATKKIFKNLEILTPKSILIKDQMVDAVKDLNFPLIVKPIFEDCSLGIESDSVVSDFFGLRKVVERLLKEFPGGLLVEEYIDGREINVAIVGNGENLEVLPFSEITFGEVFTNLPKIVDFEAKWVKDSKKYEQTVGVCPAIVDLKIKSKIEKNALEAFRVCGGRDYARVDLRLNGKGEAYFLEVNLNPDISPGGGFFRSAKTYGLSYDRFILKLVSVAAARYGMDCS